ncbi:MAG: RNA methyltransferase [Candidatus Velthaea sp.]|jgi:TrmH family RNA methyltransferase
MPIVLGPHHARLSSVRELKTPRGRREQGRFAIEGPTLIAEARRSGLEPRELYGTPAALAGNPALVPSETPVFSVPEHAFARLSDVETPSGLLAVLDLPEGALEAVLARPGPVLLLAGVNDPGNAGTLLRSAEAFGAAGVLFGRGGVDPYSPKVVRAAMGSLFRLPLAVVDAEPLLAAAAAAGRPVVAADTTGDDLDAAMLAADAIVAIGNERRGVRDWLPRWDQAVRIPQSGLTESLNAAVAGSIIFYELARLRRASVK